MSSISGQTIKKFYKQLVERDKEICRFCQCSSEIRQLIIVKKDKTKDYELENLELYCKRCSHYRQNVQSGDMCVNTDQDTSLAVNREKEPKFRRWVYERLNKSGTLYKTILINEGAERCGLSPVTTERYLMKMCSEAGLCKMIYGNVSADKNHPLFKGEIEEYDGMRSNLPPPNS